jgi:hypothetical protein
MDVSSLVTSVPAGCSLNLAVATSILWSWCAKTAMLGMWV